MKKVDMIRYIVKHQKDIDKDLIDDFDTFAKKELEDMDLWTLKYAFQTLLDAEDIMDNIYQANVIRHGRSE